MNSAPRSDRSAASFPSSASSASSAEILSAASDFMATHARQLDRLRFHAFLGRTLAPGQLLSAVDAYRNPDGGYGWGLESDLRSPESQVGAALHAFEAFEDLGGPTPHQAAELCAWLDGVTRPDGGLPFALPITEPAGCAPWWGWGDPSASSLQLTSIVAATAHRAAAHDPALRVHPWLGRATRYCLTEVAARLETGKAPQALEFAFAVRLLDTVHADYPEAADLLRGLGAHLPADGLVHVEGGTENEYLRPLDFAPFPGGPARALFSDAAVAADLQRLLAGQQEDGGWTVEYARISPAGSMEWRGAETVRAVRILRADGLL
ncbi:hypothetical protein [Yinghuangia soli]|uniref:Uncharacterized protein n=1 Tax=Yinghuangia soli TaxID=2908204 RepID=A0AA41U219_9ACTN|nr:hypothetical protein [Yinghuangia soli]MCF2528137.1 hypothetical protein [Yinghuangia soli]